MQFSFVVRRHWRALGRGALAGVSIGCALALLATRTVEGDGPTRGSPPTSVAGCTALADLAARLVAVAPPTADGPTAGVDQAGRSVVAAAGSPEPDRSVTDALRGVDEAGVAAQCDAPP